MAPMTGGRLAVRPGTNTSTPSYQGTQTEIVRQATPIGTLRLRGEPAPRRGIRWAEDVVDNEGLGRKSSKVCCIYHRPRAVGESSSEDDSSSSSDSDSDSEIDNSRARMGGKGKAVRRRHDHHHDHDDHDGHNHDDDHANERSSGDDGKGGVASKKPTKAKRKTPNAYEKMPKYRGSSTMTEVKR